MEEIWNKETEKPTKLTNYMTYLHKRKAKLKQGLGVKA